MKNSLQKQFLGLFESADSIEVDGNYYRHFDNTVHSTSGDPDEFIIALDFGIFCDGAHVYISNEDMSEISVNDDLNTWSVGGYDVCFFNVSDPLLPPK
ncbi:MAG: hypothetical protein RPS47_12625 [Colwellia sp.]|jgi:hypothetical protein